MSKPKKTKKAKVELDSLDESMNLTQHCLYGLSTGKSQIHLGCLN